MFVLSNTLMRAQKRVCREIEESNSNEPSSSAIRFFNQAIKDAAIEKGYGDDFHYQTMYEVCPTAHGGIQFGFKKYDETNYTPEGDVEYIVYKDGTVLRGRFLGNCHWVADKL